MNCNDAKRHLELFLDGELGVEANLEILRHLSMCPPCSRIFEGEKQLLELVRERGGGGSCCPPSLAARIRSCLDEETGRRGGPLVLRLLLPALAASMVVGLMAWSLSRPRPLTPERIAAVAVAHHEKVRGSGWDGLQLSPPLEGDRARDRISAFFASHAAGQKCCLHEMDRLGYGWLGARVTHREFDGRTTCWTLQQRPQDGMLVSHTRLDRDEVSFDWAKAQGGPMKVHRLRHGNREVLLVATSSCVCVFVMDAPAEVDRFLAAH